MFNFVLGAFAMFCFITIAATAAKARAPKVFKQGQRHRGERWNVPERGERIIIWHKDGDVTMQGPDSAFNENEEKMTTFGSEPMEPT